MSAKNPKAGRGPCPCCGETVLFRRSPASGRLTYSCDECDHSGYAEPGGKAHAKWEKSLRPDTIPAAPTPEPAPPAPAPAPAAKSSVFLIGGA